MSEIERSPFEYIDLTPEQIERFREGIPDLGDKAFLMVNRDSGWYLVAWEDGDTKYQYDPSDYTRRSTNPDGTWSHWEW